jgi:hypothetical protein
MARPNALERSGDGWQGLGRFQAKLAAFDADLLPVLGALMRDSIVDGSSITGAPGQPRAEGDLAASWTLTLTETSAQVSTPSPYAIQNEDGVKEGGKPYVQRSAVGGRHSVRLTRLGLPKLVRAAAQLISGRAAA